MPWEWEYRSNPQRWVLTVDDWHAVVQRVDGQDYQWQPVIEQTAEPRDWRTGPTTRDPMTARAWCLATIAELRSEQH